VTGRHFDCREAIKNETFRAEVDEGYRTAVPSNAECPFFISQPTGGVCATYETRPRICREYRCATMRIFDASGIERGHIAGRRYLVTEDPVVERVWNAQVGMDGDEDAWRAQGDRALDTIGYRAVWYD
jgi:hypothetical protein